MTWSIITLYVFKCWNDVPWANADLKWFRPIMKRSALVIAYRPTCDAACLRTINSILMDNKQSTCRYISSVHCWISNISGLDGRRYDQACYRTAAQLTRKGTRRRRSRDVRPWFMITEPYESVWYVACIHRITYWWLRIKYLRCVTAIQLLLHSTA